MPGPSHRARRVCTPRADKLDADRPDARVARLAADQWGVLSLDELRGCGLSRNAVATRVRNGRLHRLHRAVYAVGHANPPLEGRLLAAVKACGAGAVLSHRSAGVIWRYLEPDERYPDVTVPGGSTRIQPRINVHRTSRLEGADVTRRSGIPITTPARTLLDLAPHLGYRALRRAVRQAQSLDRVSIRQLAEVLGRLGPRPGSRKLARIIATGPAPTRSELEDVVLELILRGGLAHPDVNVPIVLAGRRFVPDFRWPEQRLIVEADGAKWHEGKVAREDDAERQAVLEAAGERVLRVTWNQAILGRDATLTRIRAAGAPAAPDGSASSLYAQG